MICLIQVKTYHFIDNTILLTYVDDVPIRRCGGFAGIQCPSGYECIWKDPNGHETCNSPSPDASGVCRKGMMKKSPYKGQNILFPNIVYLQYFF